MEERPNDDLEKGVGAVLGPPGVFLQWDVRRDAKSSYSEDFIIQKLDYIHKNPVTKNGSW